MLPIFSKISGSGGGSGGSSATAAATATQVEALTDHVTHRPTTRRVSGRDSFTTPSIRGALNDEPMLKDRTPSHTTGKNAEESSTEAQSFTLEELTVVWKKFVEKIDAPQLKSALSSREPKLNDQSHIEYYLDNELQLQRLTLDLKPKLLGHLRREFNNESIDINFLISSHSDDNPSVPYTESEKWQALVEKYPALATLKTKFGLDFEQ